MALFKKKKEEKTLESGDKKDVKVPEAASVPEKKQVSQKARTQSRNLAAVLHRPRITEKATFQAENGVYVFEIHPHADKKDVADAIRSIYKVTPRRINIAKLPPKTFVSRMRRQKGTKPGVKKAYVYLKKGDKIELV